MAILSDLLPASPQRPLLRQILDDLGIAVAGSVAVAVLVVLVLGRPELLFLELAVSLCVGVIALAMLECIRLRGPDGRLRRGWVKPYALLALVAAPVAHQLGCGLAAFILGDSWPRQGNVPFTKHFSAILFTLIAIYCIGFVLWNRDRVERMRIDGLAAHARAEAIERQAVEAQLRLLQAQIEPHMLFNTLANLQGLIAIDPVQANRMLDQLIQYLRATLSATRADSTTLAAEFAAIEAYLGLMSVRMGARLAYDCVLPDALRGARVPALLLQPLVENAVLHGLEPKIAGGAVRDTAAVRDGLLEVRVADTGLGLDGGTPSKGGGVGLATTRRRLHALYGDRATLTLAPARPEGAVALLTLPLEDAP
jgi:hypothetical protein